MSKKQPVMSHDPFAGLGQDADKQPAAELAQVDDAGTGGKSAAVAAGQGRADVLITLESSLSIAEVAELNERILQNVRTMTPLQFDATEVETVDTAGLQLLAAAFKTGSEKGLEVRLSGASDVFANGASLIGLSSLFGIDSGNRAV